MTVLIDVPQAARQGDFSTGYVRLPSVNGNTLQVSVIIHPSEKNDPTNTLAGSLLLSTDGQANNAGAYSFTWRGNSKTDHGGKPLSGPVLRLPSWPLSGFLRIDTNTPAALRYEILAEILDGL
jgi:hypothetical protein